jgi:hypothetical protein
MFVIFSSKSRQTFISEKTSMLHSKNISQAGIAQRSTFQGHFAFDINKSLFLKYVEINPMIHNKIIDRYSKL